MTKSTCSFSSLRSGHCMPMVCLIINTSVSPGAFCEDEGLGCDGGSVVRCWKGLGCDGVFWRMVRNLV